MAIFDWLRNWQREQQRKAAEREAAAKREAERRIQAAMEAARRETERKAREEREKPTTETPDVPIVIIGGPRGGGGTPAYSITLAADDATVSGAQGTTIPIALTVTRNNGFTGTVSLAVTGLPSGVTGAFSDSSLSSGETTSTLTLTIDIAAGLVTADVFVITASASGLSDSTVNGTVTVTAASDFPAGSIYSDDYDNYADTAALHAVMSSGYNASKKYNYVFGMANVAIDAVTTYQGKKTMQYTHVPGSETIPQVEHPFGDANSPVPYAGVWVRFKIKFSSNFTLDGTGGAGRSYKLVFLGVNSANSRVAHIFSDGCTGSEWITGPIQENLELFPLDDQDELGDDNWYDFIWFAKKYSNTRVRARMWRAIDGQTPVEMYDNDGHPSPVNGQTPGSIIGYNIGRNFNKVLVSTQYINWGPWAVYDESVHSNPFGLSGV